jgi:hypothetical protein
MSNRILLIALIIIMVFATPSATELSSIIGDWKVVQIYDSPTGTEPLDLPTTGGPFIFHFVGKVDSTDSLSFYTKIGNTMRGDVQFTSDSSSNGIQFGPILSSRMMPEASQFMLEMYLSQYLPKMTTLSVSGDGQQLILIGEGRIICDVSEATEN